MNKIYEDIPITSDEQNQDTKKFNNEIKIVKFSIFGMIKGHPG